MIDPELERLELLERAAREMYERLSRPNGIGHPSVIATAREMWEEAAAALEAHKAGQ